MIEDLSSQTIKLALLLFTWKYQHPTVNGTCGIMN